MISILSPETGFNPISMDLDKLESKKKSIKEKMGKEGLELLKEIANLETEEEMARDLTKDFQRSGWRLIKKENAV